MSCIWLHMLRGRIFRNHGFHICAKMELKEIYEHYRPLFEDFILREYNPPEDLEFAESILIQGTLDYGTTVDKKYPEKFSEYCLQFSKIQSSNYPAIIKNRKYILQLISDVHSHYVFPEIYLDF